MNKRIPVADAHCDFLYYMVHKNFRLQTISHAQTVSLEYMRKGWAALQCFAAWIDPDSDTPGDEQCIALLDAYDKMLAENDALVPFNRSFSSESEKIATVLSIEGGEAIMGDVQKLHNYYKRGVRAMALTWNASNELGHPAMSRINSGLTPLGKTVVQEMASMGMAIDVAHLSERGIDDILALTSAPIYSSHTNAKAVFHHKRSMNDKHIAALAQRGGIVCINYYKPQLVTFGAATTHDIAKHIIHVAKVGGIDSVALGSDFDGMTIYPKDLKNWSEVPNLLDTLLAMGMSMADLRKVAYDNLSNYLLGFCA